MPSAEGKKMLPLEQLMYLLDAKAIFAVVCFVWRWCDPPTFIDSFVCTYVAKITPFMMQKFINDITFTNLALIFMYCQF